MPRSSSKAAPAYNETLAFRIGVLAGDMERLGLNADAAILPVAPIVTVFLGSVGCRFSVPAMVRRAVARSLGQPWPQATAGGGAQRG